MKTTKLLALVLLLLVGFTASTNAQFYVKVGAGYGFLPIAGFKYYETPGDTSSTPTVKSWGLGIQPTLGFGYMLTKNIALELNGAYLIGTALEPTVTNQTNKYTASGIFITPSLKVMAPLKSVTPYTSMGLLIGMPQLKQEQTTTGVNGTLKTTTRGGVALGIEGTLGMNIKASKKMDVFVELFGTAANWQPSEIEITEGYEGQTLGTTSYTDRTAPYEPFGNFGAKVGVSFFFGKMPKK